MNPLAPPSHKASTWSRSSGQYTTLISIGGTRGRLLDSTGPGARAQTVARSGAEPWGGMGISSGVVLVRIDRRGRSYDARDDLATQYPLALAGPLRAFTSTSCSAPRSCGKSGRP